MPNSVIEINYLDWFLEFSENTGNTLSRVAKAKAVGLNPITRSKVDLAKPNISKLLRPLLNEN